MFKAWEGKTPKPTREAGQAPQIEATIQRIMTCNASLIKECNCLKGMQIRVHSRKIQLAEVQLQSDPTNKHVCSILSKSQGKLVELFQTLVECFNHHLAPRWFRYGNICSKLFFDFHRVSKKRTFLKELDVDGMTIHKQADLSIISPNFTPTCTHLDLTPQTLQSPKGSVGKAYPPESRRIRALK